MQLEGKVALVTGGSSGIGKASALLFAQQGAKVAVNGHSEEHVNAAVAEIRAAGGVAIPAVADVSVPDEMEQAVRRIADEWGTIDVVFANAGINGVWAPLDEITAEEWDKTLDVNLKGTFLSVKYALPYLKQQGGSVIITSSVNGTRIFSNSGATAYACSKAAQVAFAKMTALELARYKIRVNVICPGWVKTDIGQSTDRRNLENVRYPVQFPDGSKIPLTNGGPGLPEQVAQLALFLASDLSNHITGTEMWIDGGESLIVG
ncbi:MAG: 3-oxoacyl-[acyl-carrier-protein] reductase [Anaerolineaceae bacterium]|nr:3-oxoacyl-[acyl-carrier-protein] reductase [Anaerolineaceae bacterium]